MLSGFLPAFRSLGTLPRHRGQSRGKEARLFTVRNYELTFIIRPDVNEETLNATVEQVKKWLGDEGNEVQRIDHWGRRRLAYSIRDQREGHYVLFDVAMKPETIGEVERNLKLSDEILRYLLVRAGE
jgi:small subunit ribosomal protein S6